MDRRIVAINNWVTARYFKKDDLVTYFRNLNYFLQRGINISPSIMVSRPTKTRKTADIILCSGVDEKQAMGKVGADKLLLNYGWSYDYTVEELIEKDRVIGYMKRKSGVEELYQEISLFLVSITDDSVEMRGVRKN